MLWERGIFVGALAAAALLSLSVSKANAATIDLAYTGVSPGRAVSVSVNSGSNYSGTTAGQFNFTASNPTGNAAIIIAPGPLLTWCVELGQYTSFSTITYSVLGGDPINDNFVSPYSGTANAAVTGWFNKYYSTSFDNDQAAAFQLGIWELTHDTTVPYDLTTGTFRVDSAVSTAAFNQAQTWLQGNFANASGPYSIYQVHSEGNQDQIFAIRGSGSEQPTPLPAALPSGLVLLAAVGLVAKVRRKAHQ